MVRNFQSLALNEIPASEYLGYYVLFNYCNLFRFFESEVVATVEHYKKSRLCSVFDVRQCLDRYFNKILGNFWVQVLQYFVTIYQKLAFISH